MTYASAIPLSLFESRALDAPEPPLKQRLRLVEWSYSRRNTFEQCLLKYYFDYYGSAKRHALIEPDKELLRTLKQRQNRYERTGEIVHEAIANYFRQSQRGTIFSSQELIRFAEEKLAQELALSHRSHDAKSGTAEGGNLLEFYNQPTAAEDLYKEAAQRMAAALRTFVEHPRFEKIRKTGRGVSVDIEKFFKLKNFPCRVTGIVDFAVNPSGTPAVVDWKSGKQTHSEDDSLQLTAYAYWGADRFGVKPESMAVYKAFLGSGELIKYKLTPASVEKGKRRIIQDVQSTVEIHEYGTKGRKGAFTPCCQKRVCILCPYLAVCKDGKESLNDRN